MLQGVLEDGGRFEAHRLGSGDLHGFSGLRIAAGTFRTLLDLERSKSDDLDLLVLFHTFDDGGEDGALLRRST